MDLATILKREDAFRRFLIKAKEDCYAQTHDLNWPIRVEYTDSRLELSSVYDFQWENGTLKGVQEVFLDGSDHQLVWEMQHSGQIYRFPRRRTDLYHGILARAILAPKTYMMPIPVRGPWKLKIGDYLYTCIISHKDQPPPIFNFTLKDRLTTGDILVYEGLFTAKIVEQAPEEPKHWLFT